MKNIRILLISIPVIIIISAVIGCVITFPSAPHAALARIFIDIGALIALVSITYTLPKPEPVQIDDIVDGLRDLAKNRFDRRLPVKDQDELFQVRQAFNELAGTLSDSRDPSLTHIRYNPMNRIELKVTPLPMQHHSHHPELGQVKSAEELAIAEARKAMARINDTVVHVEPVVQDEPLPAAEAVVHKEAIVEASDDQQEVAYVDTIDSDNAMLASEPIPVHVEPQHDILDEFVMPALAREEIPETGTDTGQQLHTYEPSIVPEVREEQVEAQLHAEIEAEAEPQPELRPESLVPPRRQETYPSDIGAADLFFLFERFKAAHDQPNENSVDFDSFMSTVHKAREELMRAHHCRDVKFEVVSDAGAVALRPRLIR